MSEEELEKENANLKVLRKYELNVAKVEIEKLEKENGKLKECLTVGTTWNKALNSINKALEEERDKYRNMVFDKDAQLNKAKEIIRALLKHTHGQNLNTQNDFDLYLGRIKEAEQFMEATE